MDVPLFILGLYLSWYFLTRVIFRMALVYFYREPFGKALFLFDTGTVSDDGNESLGVFLFHIPGFGDLACLIFAYHICSKTDLLNKIPVPTPAKMDRALIRFAERRQLRLKNSDKVGLLTEVKR